MDTAPKNGVHGRERRRVSRHPVHSPAYASQNGSSQSAPIELWEILNISESGTCIQAPGPMRVNRLLPLVLDLSETDTRIHTTGHVVWAESSGKTGIRFPDLPEVSLLQLQRWLTVNDSTGKRNHVEESPMEPRLVFASQTVRPRPNSAASYTSLIAEWAEIQRDVELFGPNLEGALQLIAERALALTWASGAAIALKNENGEDLICVARAGNDAPEIGVRLDAVSGLSGEAILSGKTLKCDDTSNDTHEECESYRALGIRSLVASPIKTLKGEILGIIEVFSSERAAFWDNDARTLERLARIIARAVAQTVHSMGKPLPVIEILQDETIPAPDQDSLNTEVEVFEAASTTVRNAVLFSLGIVAVVFAVWLAAPWISAALNGFVSPPRSQASEHFASAADFVGVPLADLKKTAVQGNTAAQYAIGLRFASGDGVEQDYHEALEWFLKAADGGNIRAASKIASCFWAGKGAEQDYSKAYFWGLLAQAAGDETGHVIVINSAPHLSDHQRLAEQREADEWLRAHHLGSAYRASR